MAINPNRFNDPALGQAFGNLAAAFAPPGSGDLVNYATAGAKKAEAERLAWLFANPTDPLADRKATMAGVYLPTQSYYAQDQNNATAQRGQDVTASTTLATNAADNARALATNGADNQAKIAAQFMTPLNPGQVQPGLPGNVASVFGVPELPRAQGNPEILTETQQKAAERQRLQASGTLTDTMLLDTILGDNAPVQAVGPNNAPIFMSPGEAARTNAPAFVQTGSQAAPQVENYRAPDGTSGTAQFIPDRGWVDTQSGQPIPQGSQTFRAGTTGNADAALTSTNSNLTQATRLEADVTSMNGLVTELENTINSQAGSAGLAANLQSIVQDSQQVVKELAAAVGDDPNALVSADTMQSVSDRVLGASTNYNPTFRRVKAMLLDLAYMNARLNNPSGEVSRFALEREMEALGLGLTGNDQSVMASISVSRQRMSRALRQAEVLRRTGKPPTEEEVLGGAAPPAAPPAVTGGPRPGDVEDGFRFKGGDPADPNAWEPI